MVYVTEKYYRKHGRYGGNDVGQLLHRAHCLVDFLTHNQIPARGFKNLTKYQQSAVRKSICLMVDFFANVDGMAASNIASYSLHGMRVHHRQSKQRPWEAAGCGMWAWFTLLSTGLMRGAM
ncbi:MAG: hypothetical protein FWE44_00390 [Defluviitaleaceae bacterium]|nr:hypothetical protein [Defluviitaleaceae bacterium]